MGTHDDLDAWDLTVLGALPRVCPGGECLTRSGDDTDLTTRFVQGAGDVVLDQLETLITVLDEVDPVLEADIFDHLRAPGIYPRPCVRPLLDGWTGPQRPSPRVLWQLLDRMSSLMALLADPAVDGALT